MQNYGVRTLLICFVLVSLMLALMPLLSERRSLAQQAERGQGVKPTNAANAERRVALIIGNGNYSIRPLANPPNDAAEIRLARLKARQAPVTAPPLSSPASDAPLIAGLQVEMVNLLGGAFTMGSNDSNNFEKPPHQVTVAAFAIGKYEVTQAQWQKVMGNNPSKFKGDNLPVENVLWKDAQEFCRKLGNGYRLPTEAEWEYAARAGSSGKWAFGNEESKFGEYAWFSGNSGSQTHPVGQKKANGLGLFDMHGNVWEWCEDDWHSNYNGAPTNGSAWKPADISARVSTRAIRGGSWNSDAIYCRSAVRGIGSSTGAPREYLGFRVARTSR